MPSRQRKKAIKRLTAWLVGIPVAAVVMIAVILWFVAWWRWEFGVIPKITYHSDADFPNGNTNANIGVPMTLPQGSFTELFSGTGWMDASNTTAYEDQMATAISLVPDFSVTVVSSSVASESALATSTTAYNPQTGTTLVIQPGYASDVFQTEGTSTIIDYTDRFGQRAFGGDSAGVLAVNPVVFSDDGAWWISDGQGSEEPKLIKVSGSSVIDYTNAFPAEGTLRAEPGPDAHSIYVIGNSQTYLLTDRGFKHTPVTWTSVALNDRQGNIMSATITRTDDSDRETADATPSGLIKYFLSNDDGATWTAAVLNQEIDFKSKGGALRFKIELSPAADPYVTPWVDNFGLSYAIDTGK